MKKIDFTLLPILLILALLLAPSPFVGAIETIDPAAQTLRVESLIQRANNEINRRLTALNDLATKVSLLKRVSDGQKAAFASEIQTNINDLTNLKIKIDADTDPVVLQADVQSLVDNYRIFALYIPKINLLVGADIASETAGSLGSLAIKLQNKITIDQKAGKNITALTALLTDMQSKISDANNQASNLTDVVMQLVPSGYPGNSNSLVSARDMLRTARSNIQAARQDAQQIINGLKAFQTTAKSTSDRH